MYRNAAKLFYLHVEPVFIFNKVEKGISVMVGVVFKLGEIDFVFFYEI